jgi:hypothetical protein
VGFPPPNLEQSGRAGGALNAWQELFGSRSAKSYAEPGKRLEALTTPSARLMTAELGTGIGTYLSAPDRIWRDGSGAETPLPSSDGACLTELQNRRNRCSPSVGRFDSCAAPSGKACISPVFAFACSLSGQRNVNLVLDLVPVSAHLSASHRISVDRSRAEAVCCGNRSDAAGCRYPSLRARCWNLVPDLHPAAASGTHYELSSRV